ncbi:MAG TPA: hypothetical protein VF633_04585 [Brevundimonas sp.]|jgi:hypothetical protein
MSNMAWVWGVVIIGGPLILAGAIAWAKLHSVPKTRKDDPDTPADDPSKGMPGHD